MYKLSIMKIIDQCEVKQIMILLIKSIRLFWRTWHALWLVYSLPCQIHCNTSDNVCIDLQNLNVILYNIYILYFFQLLTVIEIQLERLRGFVTSGILFIFWCTSLVSSIIPFYTYIMKEVGIEKQLERLQGFVTSGILFIFWCTNLVYFYHTNLYLYH